MINALLIDAFGTLFDTLGTHPRATRRILQEHNLNIDPDEFHKKWDEFIVSEWKKLEFGLQWR